MSLNDDWKAGKLKQNKDYYVKLTGGDVIVDYYCQQYDECHWPQGLGFDNVPNIDVRAVIAPVPSYEELQRLESDRLAKIEGEEIIAELKSEIKQLKAKSKDQKHSNNKILIDKEVYESALRNSICLRAENEVLRLKVVELEEKLNTIKANGNYPDKISKLKAKIKHLLDLQANQDKEVESLRELLKECKNIVAHDLWSRAQFSDGQIVEKDDLLTHINATIGESEE